MTETDIEIEAYGVSVTAFTASLHVRTPSTDFVLVSMPRALAEALVRDLKSSLDALPAAPIARADVA